MHASLPDAKETDAVIGRVCYSMPAEKGLLGRVFALLEEHKAALGIEDYAFNQVPYE